MFEVKWAWDNAKAWFVFFKCLLIRLDEIKHELGPVHLGKINQPSGDCWMFISANWRHFQEKMGSFSRAREDSKHFLRWSYFYILRVNGSPYQLFSAEWQNEGYLPLTSSVPCVHPFFCLYFYIKFFISYPLFLIPFRRHYFPWKLPLVT
jgi:hypothetical protein